MGWPLDPSSSVTLKKIGRRIAMYMCELYVMLHCFYWILLQFLNSVLLTQTQITGGGGTIERDELIIELTTDILCKVPQPYNIQVVSEQYPVLYTDSMNTVLRQVSHQKGVMCLDFHISLLLDVQQILHQKNHVHEPCCLFVQC